MFFWSKYDIYVINLRKRRNRLKTFDKHYKLRRNNKRVSYIIFDAVDGSKINEYDLYNKNIIDIYSLQSISDASNNVKNPHHYNINSKGAIGCYLSHYQIWKSAKSSKEFTIVFEDDAIVNGLTMEDIMKRLKNLPNDWHIYLIGVPHSSFEGEEINNGLYKVKTFRGTHAYIISQEGIKWLLNDNTLFPIHYQLDSYLSNAASSAGFNIYINMNEHNYRFLEGLSDVQI